jgi:hypothetical protein
MPFGGLPQVLASCHAAKPDASAGLDRWSAVGHPAGAALQRPMGLAWLSALQRVQGGL